MNGRILVAASLSIALAACADPAAEQPITMAPGLYELSQPQASLAGFTLDEKNDGKPRQICLRPGDGDFFAHRIVRESLAMKGCSDPDNKRTGNLLESTIRCPFDPEHATGEWFIRASGRIREDSFTTAVRFDIPAEALTDAESVEAAKMLNTYQKFGSVEVEARRVGECPA